MRITNHEGEDYVLNLPSYGKICAALARGDRIGAYEKLHPLKDADIRGSYRSKPELKPLFDAVEAKRASFAEYPLQTMPYTLYRRFDTPGDGDRKTYENIYFNEYCARLSASAASLLFDEDNSGALCGALCDALCDALWGICDLYTWCLPAHLSHRSLSTESYADTDAAFRPQTHHRGNVRKVDLFSSMLAADISEVLYLLEDRLPPIVVKRAKDNVYDRVLSSVMEFNHPFFWENNTSNWASVCACSVGCAAIYSIRDSGLLAPLLSRMCAALEPYFDGFGKDCMCDEGLTYWTYGFRHFIAFADLLYTRTAGDINLFDDERVKRVASSPERSMLNGAHGVSFADCPIETPLVRYMFSRLKRQYPDMPMPADSVYAKPGFDKTFSYLTRHIYMSDFDNYGSFSGGTYIAENTQWIVSRSDKTAFAAKGGHNGEHHNHNDVGSFIFQVGERQFFADLGPGLYDAQYFGPGRYKTIQAGSQGHSVPLIDGQTQPDGGRHRASQARFASDENGAYTELEFSTAYEVPSLRSLYRRLKYTPEKPCILSLSDEFEFDTPTPLTERLVSTVTAELVGGRLVLTDGINTISAGVPDGWSVKLTGGYAIGQDYTRKYDGDPGLAYCLIDFIPDRPTEKLDFRIEFIHE